MTRSGPLWTRSSRSFRGRVRGSRAVWHLIDALSRLPGSSEGCVVQVCAVVGGAPSPAHCCWAVTQATPPWMLASPRVKTVVFGGACMRWLLGAVLGAQTLLMVILLWRSSSSSPPPQPQCEPCACPDKNREEMQRWIRTVESGPATASCATLLQGKALALAPTPAHFPVPLDQARASGREGGACATADSGLHRRRGQRFRSRDTCLEWTTACLSRSGCCASARSTRASWPHGPG